MCLNVLVRGILAKLICALSKADTRIIVHVVHALEQGAMVTPVITVDVNVVVILAGHFLTYE